MRTIVCGTHKGPIEESFVWSKLDYIHKHQPITLLIWGCAKFVDTMAYRWALAHKIPAKPFPAHWDRYGNQAGPIRNTQMIKEGMAEACIAFKTNWGPGTKNMLGQAKHHKLKWCIAEEFQPELMM